ncbi:DUF4007 family protein [Desertivirga xinjiangensis]|uniref:DUF4007 family protein n=1 Tax=Desertivirga xinjiangensis TaxID=539206 RepID=UPI00210C279D|nr:DUF4007 family protein [Pedobacter xinjiangensis]
MPKFSFSGHDTFPCRQLWLKKGYDFIKANKSFKSEDAVIDLGVGKNMVSAIRFWMRAMDILTQEDELTNFAIHLLDDEGWDPYLEDEMSLWLLHYNLVKKGVASSYGLIFNELRREKIEFNKNTYFGFLKRKAEQLKALQVNEKTIFDDFGVLIKMYIRSDGKVKEDIFQGLFTELNLIKPLGKRGEELYSIENKERDELPEALFLYIILDNCAADSSSISISTIEQDHNNVTSVLAVSRTSLASRLEQISKKYDCINYSDHAGIKELQIKRQITPLEILNHYYAN